LIWIVPLCCWATWLRFEVKRRHWLGILLGIATAASTGFLFWSGKQHYAGYDKLHQLEIIENTVVALDAGQTDEVRRLLNQCVTPNIWAARSDFYDRRANLASGLRQLNESVQQPAEEVSPAAARQSMP
jgi:hypothetical protein